MSAHPTRRYVLTAVALLACLSALYVWEFTDEWLLDAVGEGKLGRAKVLISLGANVNCRKDDGHSWTPLHQAAYAGDAEMVRFLVAHGATVDAKAVFQLTPRALAQGAHRAEAEQVLVAAGAAPVPPNLHAP